MKPSERMLSALNDQVTLELASAMAYLQLAAYFRAGDLPGMATWMRVQSSEELAHADRFIAHIIDRGGRVQLGAIPSPYGEIGSPLQAFESAAEHEQRVSESIRELYRLANEEGDIDVLPLLQWFLNEQIEEEASVAEIMARIRRADHDGTALLILDQELGQRSTTT